MKLKDIIEKINKFEKKDIKNLNTPEFEKEYKNILKQEKYTADIKDFLLNVIPENEKANIETTNINKLYEASLKYLSDDQIKEIETFDDNYISDFDKDLKTEHIYNEKIQELINRTDNQKLKEDLKYINDNILIKQDANYIGSYSRIAEETPRHSNILQTKKSLVELEKNEFFKGSLTVQDSGISEKNSDYKKFNTKEFYDKFNSLDMTYSENTKENVKDILYYIDNMKDFDGNPMLDMKTYKAEEGIKKYAFKNIEQAFNLSIDSIEKGDLSNISKIVDFHKKSMGQYKELIEKVNKMNIEHIPANVSVSRNDMMPEEFLKDYKNVSKINGMWAILANIKKGNGSIEEFIESPKSSFYNSLKKYDNFKPFNKLGNELGDLNFIKAINEGNKNKDISNIYKDVVADSNGTRYFLPASMLDNQNAAKNRYVANLYNFAISNDIRMSYMNYSSEYLKGDKIQTYKNILINTSNNKDYTSLTSNNNMSRCSISGNTKEYFDYEYYLRNETIDLKSLSEKLATFKKEINDNKEYKTIKNDLDKAIGEVSFDLLKTRDITNENEFDSLVSSSGKSITEIFDAKRGNKEFSKYILDEYKSTNENGIDNTKINKTLNQLKGLNEKYNSRNIFSKYFTRSGWAERKALKEIKKDMVSKGIESEKIENFLNNKTSKEEFVSTIKPEQKETRIQIEVNEAAEKENTITNIKDIQNEPTLDLNKEFDDLTN